MGGITPQTRVDVQRQFEQPADAMSCHSDYAQIVLTETGEVVIQFYEPLPGPPPASGTAPIMRTRLRATIFLNKEHATKIGNSLLLAASTAVPKRQGP
jgi:hypothetical protein